MRRYWMASGLGCAVRPRHTRADLRCRQPPIANFCGVSAAIPVASPCASSAASEGVAWRDRGTSSGGAASVRPAPASAPAPAPAGKAAGPAGGPAAAEAAVRGGTGGLGLTSVCGESFPRVHWVAVPEAARARRLNNRARAGGGWAGAHLRLRLAGRAAVRVPRWCAPNSPRTRILPCSRSTRMPSSPHARMLVPSYPRTLVPSYPRTLVPSYPRTLVPSYPCTLVPSYIPSCSHHPMRLCGVP
jgi:hypothetical protein